jgi:hypothetical protein
MTFDWNLLANRLLKLRRSGESLIVPHALSSDLKGFRAERSKCHDNANRWCLENPDHKVVRGWLITSGTVFDKHSVIDRGAAGLMDITPLPDRTFSEFLIHEGTQEEFEGLPNQLIAIDLMDR